MRCPQCNGDDVIGGGLHSHTATITCRECGCPVPVDPEMPTTYVIEINGNDERGWISNGAGCWGSEYAEATSLEDAEKLAARLRFVYPACDFRVVESDND